MNEADYASLLAQARGLLSTYPHRIASAANLAALLYEALEDVNWAGFYFLEGDTLVLGPFQGKPACVTIPVGRGVCGMAVAQNAIQRIADVHAFDGHIACDAASRSELVIPLSINGETVGVLDIDSPVPDRFSAVDEAGIAALARAWEASLA
ncbi:GAF domain-containing protein [Marinihelvus fidelis]|uniref:GAF domain-containing protein n=1 Tax=Marinihelvus fidelis TaxID=2613842 RepID=A0A5N0T8K9_9GAMM|nr:GAF domain-containing protein [Marinihelvus fidelis]KAA9131262.1 GAF domain-containing protein [Marinihelvus fidelis]